MSPELSTVKDAHKQVEGALESMVSKVKSIKSMIQSQEPVIQQIDFEDVHQYIKSLKGTEIREIVPFNEENILIPYSKDDHREEIKKSKNKFKVIYSATLGEILKSENNVERHYSKKKFDSEIIIFDNKVMISTRGKPYFINDEKLARTMQSLFDLALKNDHVEYVEQYGEKAD